MESPPLKLCRDKHCKMEKSDRPFASRSPKVEFGTVERIANHPLPLVLWIVPMAHVRWMGIQIVLEVLEGLMDPTHHERHWKFFAVQAI